MGGVPAMADFYFKLIVKKGTGDDPCASSVTVRLDNGPPNAVAPDATGATFYVPLPRPPRR